MTAGGLAAYLHGGGGSLHAHLGEPGVCLLDVGAHCVGLLCKGYAEQFVVLLLLDLGLDGSVALRHHIQHLAPLLIHLLQRGGGLQLGFSNCLSAAQNCSSVQMVRFN